MVFETFIGLVAVLAIVYAGIARYIQNRLIDRSEMEAIQAESKKLSDDYEKARKRNDKKKMDEIMQKQMDFLPKMNKVMFGQFKPMIFILVIFALFMWAVGQVDPTVKDDIYLNMTDDGRGCDAIAGDGIYTACYNLSDNTNYGKWTATATVVVNGAQIASNETYFRYGQSSDNDTYAEPGRGEPMNLSTDKSVYQPGDEVIITSVPPNVTPGFSLIVPITPPEPVKVDNVQLKLSDGTYFRVDLPFTIPLINVQRIYQPYWWFILISLISNIVITLAMGQMQKKKKVTT